MATITPKASEITVSFQFFGPDQGTFPATSSSTAITTRKLNKLRMEIGDETADFKAGQEIVSKERIIAANPRVYGSVNLEHPDLFLKKYRDEGPLVRLTVSVLNYTLTGDAQIEQYRFDGLMKGPEIDFLKNPGTMEFEIAAYGFPVIFTASDEAK